MFSSELRIVTGLVANSILLFFSSLMSGMVEHFSPKIRNSVSGSPAVKLNK